MKQSPRSSNFRWPVSSWATTRTVAAACLEASLFSRSSIMAAKRRRNRSSSWLGFRWDIFELFRRIFQRDSCWLLRRRVRLNYECIKQCFGRECLSARGFLSVSFSNVNFWDVKKVFDWSKNVLWRLQSSQTNKSRILESWNLFDNIKSPFHSLSS